MKYDGSTDRLLPLTETAALFKNLLPQSLNAIRFFG